jgi:tripartite-type tricarboxylate transporter receptor subunit TctC
VNEPNSSADFEPDHPWEIVMPLARRELLQMAAGSAVLAAMPRRATADAYPSRPVRVVVTVPAGLTPDILARLTAERLADRLGRPFVVENRPGGGQNIGTEFVVRAQPDGYTLLIITATNAINAGLYARLDFSFAHDIAPVAALVRGPLIMEVNPSVPARTVGEFIAYAKANPGKINMASGGNGSPMHVAGELFKMMAGVDMVHVPYQNPLPDLLGGQVQVYFGPIASSLGYVRSGVLRALAVTSAARAQVLPDVPTVGETVPDYEAISWYGIGAPKGTPAQVVDKLNGEIDAALADRAIKTKLVDLGVEPMPMTPAAFGAFIAAETNKWSKVVKFASLKVD